MNGAGGTQSTVYDISHDFLSASPLKMRDLDGSPIRAVLWKGDKGGGLVCD